MPFSIFSTAWLSKLFSTTVFQSVTKTKYQTKFLPSNLTVGSGTSAALAFNNLTIGKTYRLSGTVYGASTGNLNFTASITNNGVEVAIAFHKDISGSEEISLDVNSVPFVATATTLVFNYNVVSGNISGNGTKTRTFLNLEELPNHEVTTQWT